jgi:CAAX prenyl protease-like protein
MFSPTVVRVAPFIIFLALTALQNEVGEAGRYGVYLLKTVAGAGMILAVRKHIAEMRWAISWEAVVVGVGVFAMWVGIDGLYPTLGELMKMVGIGSDKPAEPTLPWNPFAFFAGNAALAWFFVIVRFLGSTFVVPPLEEVFFRSFLYRWLANQDFEKVPLGYFAWMPFLVTSLFFAAEHEQWLAGLLCGFAYGWLVIRKKRLGDAITAHAITNALLAVWVVSRNAWNFW